MKFGIRSKLFVVSLLAVAGVGLVTVPLVESSLRNRLEHRLEVALASHARSAQALVELASRHDTIAAMDPLADRLGQATNARVTVIATDGKVLGDSHLSPAQVERAENHGSRPEVAAALAEGEGVSRRHSSTVDEDMLYVAMPYHRAGQLAGVVRIAIPLSEVDAAIGQLRLLLLLLAAVGLAVAVLLSAVASQLATRRLRALVDEVRALSTGQPNKRIGLSSSDELGRLAKSFNRLATEFEGALSELKSERDRLQTILEGMSEAVLALDPKNRVTLANPAALKLLALERAPLGRTLLETSRVPALTELVERSRLGARSPDSRAAARDGQESAAAEFDLLSRPPRRVLAHAAELKTSGGTVVVMHDVTEMRRLETVRRDFVANVSHELRTPVSVIRANAETLLDGALETEAAINFVQAIYRNAERLVHLIADLLDLSRIEAGTYGFQIRSVAVRDAVAHALETTAELAQQRGLSIRVAADPALRVAADPGGLAQILLNFVDNAVKYSFAEGHIEIRACDNGDGTISIEVEDDGPGVEPQFRDRLFERFYRVDRGRSRDMGGTGLGLSIVKHLTDAMGGSVGMRPASGTGAVFWLSIPAATVIEQSRERPGSTPSLRRRDGRPHQAQPLEP